MLVTVPFLPFEWSAITNAMNPESLNKTDEANRNIRQQALEILAGWKIRSGKNLSLAADITEVVLRAKVSQIDASCARDWWKSQNSKLLLCMAILRFVNFLEDLDPRKNLDPAENRTGPTTFASAHLFEVPDWVVHVRHKIAHQQIPSTDVCVAAVDFSLNWIWEHYWGQPLSTLAENRLSLAQGKDANNLELEMSPNRRVVNALDNLLRSFEIVRNESFYGIAAVGSEDILVQEAEVLKCISEQFTDNPCALIKVLVSEGHLLLNRKQMRTQMIQWDLAANKREIALPPAPVQKFWEPVLAMVIHDRYVDKLFDAFIEKACNDQTTEHVRQQLLSWITLIVHACNGGREKMVPSDAQWACLFRKVVHNPQVFDFKLISQMARHLNPPMKESTLMKVELLLDVYLGKYEENVCDENENPMFTAADAESMVIRGANGMQQNQEMEEEIVHQVPLDGGWIREDRDWMQYPIGLLPGQSPDTLDLNLALP